MKILIIEDEAGIRQTLEEILRLEGYEVVTASDGPGGVAAIVNRPDLVLCDVGLPGLDGFGVLARIQATPEGRTVPFIFLTGRADREDQRRGMALGADDYITKPFTRRDILQAITARIRRQQPLRERITELVVREQRTARADWSHELMTPLNGVLGGLQLIEAEADSITPSELRELLGLIRAGAERQFELSRKLVLFYELERLENAAQGAAPAALAAGPVVESAAARMAAARQRPADLTLQVAPGSVRVAEAHLSAAIGELVENAFRFSSAGTPVRVEAAVAAGSYVVRVADRGAGLTEEELAQVAPFVRFRRGRPDFQGLGLGLAIARLVARLHGGSLTLASNPAGTGVVATLTFPVGSA